jgi:hypothetical protein
VFDKIKDAFDIDIALADIIYLFIEGIIFMLLVFLVEYMSQKNALSKSKNLEKQVPDNEVQNEDNV